jgi:Protein of unknown function (DUF4064)/Short C-terminal domain
LRTYQTLTLIGAILGILTTIGYWITMIGLDAFVTSFDESMRESEFYTPDPEDQRQYQENKSSMAYINAAAPTSIVILVIILIITMVIKNQTKILGIILIVVAVTELILTSAFGVIPLALLLPAGILALRWKSPRYEPTYTSSSSPSFLQPVSEASDQDKKEESVSIADELSRLARLKEQGVITEEEFTQMKTKLINGQKS